MTNQDLNGIWNYYLSLEQDLSNTSRYIEPQGQEDVHSFEFAKILILACTEVESVFKAICFEITKKQPTGNIGKYKEIILGNYPRIVEATVLVSRLDKNIRPFSEWSSGKLAWWEAYQQVKHSRGTHFGQASYKNSVNALAALYIAILYLARISNIEFDNYKSSYIESEYCYGYLIASPVKKLPDFDELQQNREQS